MKQNLSDPVIDEIREVRHRIPAHFGYDPTQLVAFYMEMQKQYQNRLINPAKNTERRDQPPCKYIWICCQFTPSASLQIQGSAIRSRGYKYTTPKTLDPRLEMSRMTEKDKISAFLATQRHRVSHGLTTSTSRPSKSLTLRVAMARSWVFAVPAISASPKSSVHPDRCACARNRAAHSAPTLSKGRMRSSYSAMIPSRLSCRPDRRCPCAIPRPSKVGRVRPELVEGRNPTPAPRRNSLSDYAPLI